MPEREMSHNNRLEKDLRPARCARWSRPLSLIRYPSKSYQHKMTTTSSLNQRRVVRAVKRFCPDFRPIRHALGTLGVSAELLPNRLRFSGTWQRITPRQIAN